MCVCVDVDVAKPQMVDSKKRFRVTLTNRWRFEPFFQPIQCRFL